VDALPPNLDGFFAAVVLSVLALHGCFTAVVVIGWMFCHRAWLRWLLCHRSSAKMFCCRDFAVEWMLVYGCDCWWMLCAWRLCRCGRFASWLPYHRLCLSPSSYSGSVILSAGSALLLAGVVLWLGCTPPHPTPRAFFVTRVCLFAAMSAFVCVGGCARLCLCSFCVVFRSSV
jgi:hypothetical protein